MDKQPEKHLDLNSLKALKNKIKQENEEKYWNESKKRLTKILTTKLRTSFIGALSAFEENFGFLWAHGDNDEITEEQEYMRDLWDKTRTTILNNGNNQIRASQNEIMNHDVHWNRYQMVLPVKPMENKEEEENE